MDLADAEAGLFSDGDQHDDASALLAGQRTDAGEDLASSSRGLLRPGAVVKVCAAAALVGAGALLAASLHGPRQLSRGSVRGGLQVKAWLPWFGNDGDDAEEQSEEELQKQLSRGYDYTAPYLDGGEGDRAAYGPMLHDTDRFVNTPTDALDEPLRADMSDVAGTLGQTADAQGDRDYSFTAPYDIRSDPEELEALHPNHIGDGEADRATVAAAPTGRGANDPYQVNVDASEEAALHMIDDMEGAVPAEAAVPSPAPLEEVADEQALVDAGVLADQSDLGLSDTASRSDHHHGDDDHEFRAGVTFTKTTTVVAGVEIPQVFTPTETTPTLDSLFCFSVMMSSGYELPLMQEQLSRGAGIFGCERFAILSDAEVELSTTPNARVSTENIGDLHCTYGGPYNLALNSEVFVRAWKRVFADGFYRHAAWTVKADPDAVFLPDRLRRLVAGTDPHASVYLNNCDHGLHGPIEVIALGAMETFDAKVEDCVRLLKKEFSWSGEDVFLRHCLGYLKVNRVDSFTLLKEDHCFNKNPKRDGCFTGEVSFHPFKDNAGWFNCLAQAQDSDHQAAVQAKRLL